MFNKMTNRERGSIVVISLFLMMVASISTLLMSQALTDHQRQNTRRRELWRAMLIAESGIEQVKHWGLKPEDYTPDTNLFLMASASGTGESNPGLVNVVSNPELIFPDLASALSSGPITLDESALNALGVGSFTTSDGTYLGRIEQIRLIAAESSDPVSSFFKIESTGRSDDGLRRVVLAYMDLNPLVGIAVPAGLISLTSGQLFGNGRIHWGEAWSKTDFEISPNPNNMSYLADDPLAIYRTVTGYNFSSNWKVGDNSATDHLYDLSADQPGLFPDGSGTFADSFIQNVAEDSLNWPDFDSHYQTFKDLALVNGRYYSTDSAGNIYRDGVEDEAHKVDFLEEFGIEDRARAPHDLVFIDTIDGSPPSADGSNLASIKASGNGLGLKGVFYINANFDGKGVGSPGSVTVPDPDGNATTLSKILLDGVIYASGTLDLDANGGVYGAAIAQRGFSGGGTPDIYYNSNLADGMPIDNGSLGSPFRVAMRTNYGIAVE